MKGADTTKIRTGIFIFVISLPKHRFFFGRQANCISRLPKPFFPNMSSSSSDIFLLSLFILFLTSISLWGCDILSGSGSEGPSQPDDPANVASQEKPQSSKTRRTPPLKHVDRLTNDVEVRGPLKPGQPVKITLTATSHLQTKEVRARLYLPELSVLRRGPDPSGRPAVFPVGEKLPAAAKFNRGMGKGQSIRRQVTIRPEKSGYYMVSAAVWAPDAEQLTEEGVPIDNTTSKEFWIWISKDGGKITETFDPTLFPESYHPAPGPLTSESEPPAFQIQSESTDMKSHESSSNTTAIRFTYFDPIEGKVFGISGARIRVKEENEYSGDVEYYTDVTDQNGNVNFPCSSGGYGYASYEGTYRASGDEFTVLNNSDNSVLARGSTYEAACGYTFEARVSTSQYFVWQEMKRIKRRSENFYGGLSRGSITVHLESDADNAFYRIKWNGDEKIVLDKDTYGTSNLSEYDIKTMAHEYGHAFHEKAIGGYAVEGSCPDPHYLAGAHDLDCAFQEGYAQFHAAVTVADSNEFRTVIEDAPDNYIYPATFGDGDPTDGSIIEGTVAAFLYDLTDPKNESHDDLNLPGSYVADVIGSCGGRANGGGFFEANGVDHLVACFQLQKPPYSEKYNEADYYFDTRSYSLRADGYITENADEPSGWNRPDIRKLWHRTLYDGTP